MAQLPFHTPSELEHLYFVNKPHIAVLENSLGLESFFFYGFGDSLPGDAAVFGDCG